MIVSAFINGRSNFFFFFSGDDYSNTGIPFQNLFLGRSVIATQTADIIRVVKYLQTRSDVVSDQIHLISFDNSTISSLHAAALQPSSIRSLALIQPLLSYEQVVSNEFYNTFADIDLFGGLVNNPLFFFFLLF